MFYSKSTGGFYDTAIHGNNIPADAVEITKAKHQELMNAQSNGSYITADIDGNPIAEIYVPTPQEIARRQIATLEASITPRRIREQGIAAAKTASSRTADDIAALAWMTDTNAQIAALRVQL